MIELDMSRMKGGTVSAVQHLASVLLISEQDALIIFDTIRYVVALQDKPPVFNAEKAKTGFIGATVAIREVLPHLTVREARDMVVAVSEGGHEHLMRIMEHVKRERDRYHDTLELYEDILTVLSRDFPDVLRLANERVIEERVSDAFDTGEGD